MASLLLGLIELLSVCIVLLAPTTWLEFGYGTFGSGASIPVRGIEVDGVTGGDGWLVGIVATCAAALAIAFRFLPALGRLWAPGMAAAGLLIAVTGFYDIFKDWSTSPDTSTITILGPSPFPSVVHDADATVWLWLVAILGSLISAASLALLRIVYATPAGVSDDIQAAPEAQEWA